MPNSPWPFLHQLYTATLPHYCCGLIVANGVIVDAAPIAFWTVRKSLVEFERWARSKGGRVEVVAE